MFKCLLSLLEIVESPPEIVSHFRKSLRARLVRSIAYHQGNDKRKKRTIRPIGIMLRMHLTDFAEVWDTQIAKLVKFFTTLSFEVAPFENPHWS